MEVAVHKSAIFIVALLQRGDRIIYIGKGGAGGGVVFVFVFHCWGNILLGSQIQLQINTIQVCIQRAELSRIP